MLFNLVFITCLHRMFVFFRRFIDSSVAGITFNIVPAEAKSGMVFETLWRGYVLFFCRNGQSVDVGAERVSPVSERKRLQKWWQEPVFKAILDLTEERSMGGECRDL